MQLYLDMDGVLADFDSSAEAILKTDNIYKYKFVWGPKVFWEKLNEKPYFFRDLSPKDDMVLLWRSVEHMNPTVLTALPKTNGDRVEEQKRAWLYKYLRIGSDRVICCRTHEKPDYCNPGDIIIDDRATNRDAWMGKGGTYIIHTSAQRSVETLKALGIIS
jgi:hypothetical protein